MPYQSIILTFRRNWPGRYRYKEEFTTRTYNVQGGYRPHPSEKLLTEAIYLFLTKFLCLVSRCLFQLPLPWQSHTDVQFKANFTFLDKKPEGDGDSSTPVGYRGPVHPTLEGFENGASFLRPVRPSILSKTSRKLFKNALETGGKRKCRICA